MDDVLDLSVLVSGHESSGAFCMYIQSSSAYYGNTPYVQCDLHFVTRNVVVIITISSDISAVQIQTLD